LHPHTGVELDRGLYAPLIVDDPAEPLSYDQEWIVVLDDWLDGVNAAPDEVLAELRKGMTMNGSGGMPAGGHMAMGATSVLLGGDAGDVTYPYFLLNGRLPEAPDVLRARPGDRVRIRIINAGADTAFRVALGGHQLRVTHTDGYPVRPVDTDTLLIGMGERYDVLATVGSGVFPLVALAEGKNAIARGLIRTTAADAPPPDARPRELDGRVVSYRRLAAADSVQLPRRSVDRTVELKLTGSMMRYDWGINGRRFDPKRISELREGERVKLSFVNTTTMWHPMHLHGHTFALEDAGTRKDTVVVRPGEPSTRSSTPTTPVCGCCIATTSTTAKPA
jgi:FtsP/CotA-like multicopper oxidase with cupredoxin domain